MTETTTPATPPPNLALIKLVTAFLGFLLLGGLALLVLLLFTRDGGAGEGGLAPLVLGEDETIMATAIGDGSAMFTILDASGDGAVRVVFVELSSGRQTVMPVEKRRIPPLTDRRGGT